ncbi:LOW QUALITY PROTEIN: hypothetical protein TorRG33x02_259050 [Trema orientale]|uniref:Uncharacterized protein n=1 Tax=Trema orientale TaxID=63057 RepID=A0A2P5D849_TREOI|nr:LOW QUALITY PROTEIN: hypothetical protein TorRG33x02_259050 [Trema orientale]
MENNPICHLPQLLSNLSRCANSLFTWHRHYFGDFKTQIKAAHPRVAYLNNVVAISEKILDEFLA